VAADENAPGSDGVKPDNRIRKSAVVGEDPAAAFFVFSKKVSAFAFFDVYF
jgi:hypothetical protein